MTARLVKSLAINSYGGPLKVLNVPLRKLQPHETLVKVEMSPLHPADIGFMAGIYGRDKPQTFPLACGFECSGRIAESPHKDLIGKKCACFADMSNPLYHGTFSEYTIVDDSYLVVFPEDAKFNNIACACINPFTANSFLYKTMKGAHKAVLQTAAASAVGKMFLQLCQNKKIPIINIIRNDEEANEIKALGATNILNYMNANFVSELDASISKFRPTVCFNSVGNDLTSKILKALPYDSTIYQYGNITLKNLGEMFSEPFLFGGKTLTGLWFPRVYKYEMNEQDREALKREVVNGLLNSHIYDTKIQGVYKYEQYDVARKAYLKGMTKGKVLLTPN